MEGCECVVNHVTCRGVEGCECVCGQSCDLYY